MDKLIKYFLGGLLFVVPISVTVYVLVISILWIDNLIPLSIPGLGLIVILITITLIGYAATTFIARPFFVLAERLLARLPLVKIIYTSLKDLLSAFVGDKKKFNQPVLVLINRNTDLRKLGFITQDDLSHLNITGSIAVYLPHSYNFSGDLYIVPKENVTLISASSTDIMKFIVSGGVTDVS
jgi:uncharacterized membrane protein